MKKSAKDMSWGEIFQVYLREVKWQLKKRKEKSQKEEKEKEQEEK